MDNLDKIERATADTAEAENKENAAAVLGKFKNVETLCKAYSELEAEFTRRSQRLKELENVNKTQSAPDGAEKASSVSGEEELIKNALSNAKVRDAVIGEYLQSVANFKGVPLVTVGSGVAAPRATPKSVKEAGRLAQQYLKG